MLAYGNADSFSSLSAFFTCSFFFLRPLLLLFHYREYAFLNGYSCSESIILEASEKGHCSKDLLTSTTRIIEEYSGINILGLIPNLGNKFVPEDLITGILNGVDIESVFNIKIEKLDFN